jgi:hypothetical protein
MDTDADRLAMLKACGGVQVHAQNGDFVAIFDAAYQSMQADPSVESSSPALNCRTSDVELLKLTKGQPLRIGELSYRILRHEPDGTGISVLVLKL